MIVESEGGIITINLEPECTIASVEVDRDKIRPLLDDAEKVSIIADKVEEIDTAYLQLILSIMETSHEWGFGCELKDSSDQVKEIFEIYSIK